MNELLQKAQELAELIKTSKEYLLAKETEAIQANDEKAQQMIQAYNDKRRDIAVRMQCSQLSEEETEAVRKEINDAFNELMEYDVIKNYVEAQKDFEILNQQIMNIISGAVNGGCGGSCSSCSGCH
ncbi:MAG: YlbF family regulator [Clostridia bacterium]|nr:YlbF family regulator [Oscillospiraceae bacterium]MBR4892557.1 YlbF family regulator [Clostridia bacterium]